MTPPLPIRLLAGSTLMLLLFASPAPGETVAKVDLASSGLTFAGLGSLSAGASSRLLIDYPEPQRSEILDLLFKPGCGAAFQHLKVEIGGDINSTDGTEPSHARTREEFEHPKPAYFDRGYEAWLMREAKKRNPAIKLDILSWGAPGWIGDRPEPPRPRTALAEERLQWFVEDIARRRYGQTNFLERWQRFYSQDNADFIAAYLLGLKQHAQLDIDYCGVWNEVHYDASWIKLLRRTLDARGLSRVGIVAADQCFNKRWGLADEMLEDPELMDAIASIGAHYTNYQPPTTNAWKTGKPLAASEECDWGGGDWGGAMGYARSFNRNYINGRLTRNIVWSTVVSYYDNLPAAGRGAMRANQPWSGHYQVSPGLWAFAHTTQFTEPGWRYLDSGCGLLAGGSYVTMADTNRPERFSIVIETSQAKSNQTLQVRLADAVRAERLHIWKSTAAAPFVKQPDLVLKDGACDVSPEPRALYTVTSTDGQGKAAFTPPPPARFPFPYANDFDACALTRSPPYFADLGGVFEVVPRPEGGGRCLRQVLTRPGIDWIWVTPAALTIVGDTGWRDYRVACDARSDGPGKVVLYGRMGGVSLAQHHGVTPWNAYALEVEDTGAWRLKAGAKVLAEGNIEPKGANPWWHLELSFRGDRIAAKIDGAPVAELTDAKCRGGMVGVGSGWHPAWFDNLTVSKEEQRP